MPTITPQYRDFSSLLQENQIHSLGVSYTHLTVRVFPTTRTCRPIRKGVARSVSREGTPFQAPALRYTRSPYSTSSRLRRRIINCGPTIRAHDHPDLGYEPSRSHAEIQSAKAAVTRSLQRQILTRACTCMHVWGRRQSRSKTKRTIDSKKQNRRARASAMSYSG